jgi:hypothetical protein
MASQEEPLGATIAEVGCTEAQPDILWIHMARITFRGSQPRKTLEAVPKPTVYARTLDLVLDDLSDQDAERVQRLRVAAYHRNWKQNST